MTQEEASTPSAFGKVMRESYRHKYLPFTLIFQGYVLRGKAYAVVTTASSCCGLEIKLSETRASTYYCSGCFTSVAVGLDLSRCQILPFPSGAEEYIDVFEALCGELGLDPLSSVLLATAWASFFQAKDADFQRLHGMGKS